MKKKFTYRIATKDDVDDIRALMDLAIYELQKDFLDEKQLKAAHEHMGIDYTLIEDGTYFVILHGEGSDDETIVGCGGWGKRATLYGGSHSAGRSAELLNPKTDRARIRAMYCHPEWARNGIGSFIMDTAENAAKEAGFSKMTMGSTLAGQPLYEHYGYKVVSSAMDVSEDGTEVPILVMEKDF
ncbi:MAG: GNAT family N-acetyltransferase [Kordiimonadaceae bacterium]|nr:GNAT family N-acetyltransferase [Kordiimonadaceae bacterium]